MARVYVRTGVVMRLCVRLCACHVSGPVYICLCWLGYVSVAFVSVSGQNSRYSERTDQKYKRQDAAAFALWLIWFPPSYTIPHTFGYPGHPALQLGTGLPLLHLGECICVSA